MTSRNARTKASEKGAESVVGPDLVNPGDVEMDIVGAFLV